MIAYDDFGSLAATVPFKDRLTLASGNVSMFDCATTGAASSTLTLPNKWVSAIMRTFGWLPARVAVPVAGCVCGAIIGSPLEDAGTNIHTICDSCQAIATTSARVTQRGRCSLAIASADSPSKLLKSDHFAVIAISPIIHRVQSDRGAKAPAFSSINVTN